MGGCVGEQKAQNAWKKHKKKIIGEVDKGRSVSKLFFPCRFFTSRKAGPASFQDTRVAFFVFLFFSFFLLCNGTSQSFGFGREFSKTLQKFPETNPVSGYGRILKCLRAGQKELVSSRSCVSVSLFSSSSFFVSRSRPCAAFTTRRPRWLWRRRSLSRSGS